MYYKHLSSALLAPCGNTPIQTVASSGAMCRKRKNHGCFRLEEENAMSMFGKKNNLC